MCFYLRLIHPGCTRPPLPIRLLKNVGRVERETTAAVVQRGVTQLVCVLLADLLQAWASDPRRGGLHVEELPAVSEAAGHGGAQRVGRRHQTGGQDAEQVHLGEANPPSRHIFHSQTKNEKMSRVRRVLLNECCFSSSEQWRRLESMQSRVNLLVGFWVYLVPLDRRS